MPLSTYAADEVIAFLTKNTTTLPSGPFYLALLTQSPVPADTGTTIDAFECSAASYARIPLTMGASWLAIANGVSDYNTEISFQTTEVWGTFTHFAICTAATAGNIVAFGPLNSPTYIGILAKVILPADTIRMAVA